VGPPRHALQRLFFFLGYLRERIERFGQVVGARLHLAPASNADPSSLDSSLASSFFLRCHSTLIPAPSRAAQRKPAAAMVSRLRRWCSLDSRSGISCKVVGVCARPGLDLLALESQVIAHQSFTTAMGPPRIVVTSARSIIAGKNSTLTFAMSISLCSMV
jgi:hypothetical protein